MLNQYPEGWITSCFLIFMAFYLSMSFYLYAFLLYNYHYFHKNNNKKELYKEINTKSITLNDTKKTITTI